MKKPWGILQEVYGERLHLIPRRWVVLPKSKPAGKRLLRAKTKRAHKSPREFERGTDGAFQLPVARGFYVPSTPISPTWEDEPTEPESAKKNFPKI